MHLCAHGTLEGVKSWSLRLVLQNSMSELSWVLARFVWSMPRELRTAIVNTSWRKRSSRCELCKHEDLRNREESASCCGHGESHLTGLALPSSDGTVLLIRSRGGGFSRIGSWQKRGYLTPCMSHFSGKTSSLPLHESAPPFEMVDQTALDHCPHYSKLCFKLPL